MKEVYSDICIIGGGASGLIAAIKAADINPDASVLILEKLDEVGHKVAASGNGRCNLSNIKSPEWEKTSLFFSTIGLFTRTDSDGRIYPYSEDGRDVVSILKKACEERGVEIITRREVTKVSVANDSFSVNTFFNRPKAYRRVSMRDGKSIGANSILRNVIGDMGEDEPFDVVAKEVLIAAGGKSKPKMGTTGDGYGFARELGHSVTPLIPVLTGVEVTEFSEDPKAALYRNLSGVRQKANITLKKNNNDVFQEYGEIQFTDYGISGICVFDLSRFLEGKDLSEYEIQINFTPDFDDAFPIESLISIVKEPLAECILSLGCTVKNFTLHPKGLRGWEMAQVTRGGVPLSEINEETGESLIVSGLFFSGEMLDVDFRCGGFNLQNAWTTGLRAGEFMAKKLL